MTDTKAAITEVATSLAFTLGLLSLGIATGVQLSLHAVQGTVMTTHLIPLEKQAPDLYPVLVELQSIVNWAGYLAAALLVGGAVLARWDMVSATFTPGDSDA